MTDPAPSRPSSAPGAAPGGAGSVLVVDDDASNRESLSRRLQRRGYAVKTAVDGADSLRQLAAESFDLVLLDVMMPGMSGTEVLKVIRQTHSPATLPVIMATARDQSEDVVAALELGANDYVTKPLDFAVVAARVRAHISLKQAVSRVLDLEQRLSQRNAELEAANAKLLATAEQTRLELEAAARVQESLLPTAAPPMKELNCAWVFKPCQELAGDALNVFELDDDHVGLFVLDVSGHGVAASLLAVAATRLLSMTNDADSIVSCNAPGEGGGPRNPGDVAERLNRKFPWNPATLQFLTLFYAVLNVRTRDFAYVSAGHPGAIHTSPGATLSVLESSGLPIGVGEKYEFRTVRLGLGDRVYLYSDGVTETMDPQKELFGDARLRQAIQGAAGSTLRDSVSAITSAIDTWRDGLPSRDDVSVLAIECV